MSTHRTNISEDLLWEIVRSNNAYLVKRKTNGGVQFSRDPFNLVNKHSRTHAGFINNKAVSVQQHGDKGITLQTKKQNKSNHPKHSSNKHNFGKGQSNQAIYKNIANSVGKNKYRSDLNKDAVSRASHLLDSQRSKKDQPAKKPRGVKAQKEQS